MATWKHDDFIEAVSFTSNGFYVNVTMYFLKQKKWGKCQEWKFWYSVGKRDKEWMPSLSFSLSKHC